MISDNTSILVFHFTQTVSFLNAVETHCCCSGSFSYFFIFHFSISQNVCAIHLFSKPAVQPSFRKMVTKMLNDPHNSIFRIILVG